MAVCMIFKYSKRFRFAPSFNEKHCSIKTKLRPKSMLKSLRSWNFWIHEYLFLFWYNKGGFAKNCRFLETSRKFVCKLDMVLLLTTRSSEFPVLPIVLRLSIYPDLHLFPQSMAATVENRIKCLQQYLYFPKGL